MTKIRPLKDSSVLDVPKAKQRQPSPRTVERRIEAERLQKLMKGLVRDDQAFEVVLEPTDSSATVRARLLKAASIEGKVIAIRKYGSGFAVGLMTPDRRSNRGRRPRQGS